MSVLDGLEPKSVWRFFEEISSIPRASYHEKAVSDYVCEFAEKRGLACYQDEIYNVVIIKEATQGYEEKEPYIIQGHLDMVCEKTADSEINFDTDPLELAVDRDFVYAKGTTLGGDDGIAVAYALALLDSDTVRHPRLEVVLTVSEEVGMDGARAIDLSMLKGRRLLNIDSEEEGVFLTSCAGGCVVRCRLPVKREEKEGIVYELHAKGMSGGHSGCEIDKGRANANLVLARLLMSCRGAAGCRMVSEYGGLKDNAIPREAEMTVFVQEEGETAFLQALQKAAEDIKKEYGTSDPQMDISFVKIEKKARTRVLDADSQQKALMLMNLLPAGVQRMSADVEGLVETSLNLGISRLDENELLLCYSVRSSVGTAKESLVDKIRFFIECAGGTCETEGDYPAWEYRKASKLREEMTALYEQMFGKKPKVQAVHAGLECGLLSDKIEDLDCVSFGPDIFGIHTVEERISIRSAGAVWKYLLALLER